MMSRQRTFTRIAAAVLGLCAASPAYAATCGIIGSAVATGGQYDPFNPTAFSAANVTLTLQRVNGPGGQKTDFVSFYLKSNSTAADGTSVTVNSIIGKVGSAGVGLDVFYDYNQAPPSIPNTGIVPTSANPFLRIAFTGNDAASDFATVNFTISLPAYLDLPASLNLPFDAIFTCSTTGGGGPTTQYGSISNAIVFPIEVLSALQASFAGTALDFDEIGDVTDTMVANSPNTYITDPNNHIRVQSSGPYQVQLTSANGYAMTPAGAPTSAPLQRVNYELKFLNEVRSSTNTATIQTVCSRAGVGTVAEDQLDLQARLTEGGANHVVSGNYRDILTVTLSPLIATAPTSGECSTRSGNF